MNFDMDLIFFSPLSSWVKLRALSQCPVPGMGGLAVRYSSPSAALTVHHMLLSTAPFN